MPYLMKEEPSNYNYDAFAKDGGTTWTGVKNPVAQKNLRSVKKGDKIFFYHTGDEKAVVGVMKANSGPQPDPKSGDEKAIVIEVVPVRAFTNAVTLSRIKAQSKLASWDLVRNSRLSVMPVTDAQWQILEQLARKPSE